jgi:hypothetical protein
MHVQATVFMPAHRTAVFTGLPFFVSTRKISLKSNAFIIVCELRTNLSTEFVHKHTTNTAQTNEKMSKRTVAQAGCG